MRSALSGVTLRGRAFLLAGVVCVGWGLFLDERDLMRVGVLLLALPLIAAAVVARTRYRITCTRVLDPPRTPAGQTATIRLRLDNVSRLPSGVLLVEDRLPFVLGGRPRFVLDRVEPQGSRSVSYRVRSDVRGRFRVGPLRLRIGDPLGLCQLTRSFTSYDSLVVTPQVWPLPHVAVGGDWSGGLDSDTRALAAAGEDDVATREYRQGDELRRVHWRSTARYGELMVRREEQPRQSRCALLLDTRSSAHFGEGPGSSFEWAVSAAASIGVHLSRAGYAVRVVTDDGTEVTGLDRDGMSQSDVLLDALAVVEQSGGVDLHPGIDRLRAEHADGLVVAILGQVHPDHAERLVRLRTGSGSAVAICLDARSWGASARARRAHPHAPIYDDVTTMLRRNGWQVLAASHGDALAALWSGAGDGADDVASAGAGSA